MNALGMIETRGLIAAIEACDVMLKTADVSLVGMRKVKAGLVTILIEGDVAAVKASVDAGSQAADIVTAKSVISVNIIARPDDKIKIVYSDSNDICNKKVSKLAKLSESSKETGMYTEEPFFYIETDLKTETEVTCNPIDIVKIHSKDDLDKFVEDVGIDLLCAYLEALSVTKLRKIIRQYTGLSMSGNVSSAKKEKLISVLHEYYLNK